VRRRRSAPGIFTISLLFRDIEKMGRVCDFAKTWCHVFCKLSLAATGIKPLEPTLAEPFAHQDMAIPHCRPVSDVKRISAWPEIRSRERPTDVLQVDVPVVQLGKASLGT
jgi:hypothetical protein